MFLLRNTRGHPIGGGRTHATKRHVCATRDACFESECRYADSKPVCHRSSRTCYSIELRSSSLDISPASSLRLTRGRSWIASKIRGRGQLAWRGESGLAQTVDFNGLRSPEGTGLRRTRWGWVSARSVASRDRRRSTVSVCASRGLHRIAVRVVETVVVTLPRHARAFYNRRSRTCHKTACMRHPEKRQERTSLQAGFNPALHPRPPDRQRQRPISPAPCREAR